MNLLKGWNSSWAIRVMVLVVSALIPAPFAAKAGSDRLWQIVNSECMPGQRERGNPAPCSEVNVSKGMDGGFVVLKDQSPTKPHAYLLIPTRRVTGIEAAELLEAGTPNYFGEAWTAKSHLIRMLKVSLGWDMVGLAVNSAKDRSQDQLHIHIDCIRSDIRSALRSNEDVLDDHWSELEFPTPDHSYMTMKFATDSLDGSNPFKLLAAGVPGAKDEMGLETLVVVGSVFRDGKRGFYLLSSRHAAGVRAHGEDLLDPSCGVADRAISPPR